jgi:RimJ/RimL family protein N-acetyltransferase
VGNISIKIGGCMQTERLIIKPTTINDIDLLLKMDKQEITQKYLGGIKNKTREERIEFLKKKSNSYTVYLKDNTPTGFIEINKNNELGYIFDYAYCNKGYCTEACT